MNAEFIYDSQITGEKVHEERITHRIGLGDAKEFFARRAELTKDT